MPFRLNTAHSFYPVICALSMRSADAGHPKPANCSCNASTAVIPHGAPVPAATAAAHNARTMKPRFGWIANRKSFCRLSTSWQPLRFPMSSDSWPGITKPSSITSFLLALASTLKDFGLNPNNLGADIGMTAVLHTHNRRLDYHPHVHVVVPGGGVDKAKKQWKKKKSKYLFNEFALAKVFRARFLQASDQSRTLLTPFSAPQMGGRLHTRRKRSVRFKISCRDTYTEASSVKTISSPIKMAMSPLNTSKAVPAKPATAPSKAKTSCGLSCNMFYPKAFAGSETMAFCMATPKSCCPWFSWFCRF